MAIFHNSEPFTIAVRNDIGSPEIQLESKLRLLKDLYYNVCCIRYYLAPL